MHHGVACSEAMRTSGEPVARLGGGFFPPISLPSRPGSPEPGINTALRYPKLDFPTVWKITERERRRRRRRRIGRDRDENQE